MQVLSLPLLPPFPRAQKSFIFVVYVWSCGIFSCYLTSSTFMWYAHASGQNAVEEDV